MLGIRQYVRYVNVITASGYASGMNRICIGYDSSSHHPFSVKLGEGGFGARPHVFVVVIVTTTTSVSKLD